MNLEIFNLDILCTTRSGALLYSGDQKGFFRTPGP